MIGLLLISHGKMAEGIKDSVEMIVGNTTNFDTLALIPGQDIANLGAEIIQKCKTLNTDDGVLILVDLFGASPYNASMKSLPQLTELGIKVRIVTGMSLPMVITAVCNRDGLSIEALTQDIISAAVDNIKDAIIELDASSQPSNDGDDY